VAASHVVRQLIERDRESLEWIRSFDRTL